MTTIARLRTLVRFCCVAAVVLPLVAGCGGGRIGKVGDVRLVNATTVADYKSLDLYAGDERIASAVGSDGASSYAEVDAGTRALSLRLADGGAQLASASAAVSKDAHYTVLAYVGAAGALSSVVLGDDESAPGDGSAKVRVLNAAAGDAGTLNAYLSPTGCTALSASNAVATGAGATAPSAYATFGAAAGGTRYHLCVTAAGDSGDLRLDVPTLTLTSRQVTTVVLTATASGTLVNALVVDQQGATTAQRNANARLRVVADAAGKATVSVTLGGSVLASAAGSPSVGNYATVAAGALTADLRIGGTAVAPGTLTVPAGADLTLLVAGSAAAPTVNLITDDNRPSTATSAPTRLRLLHGVNGVADKLALSADLSPVAGDVDFGTASKPANVAALAGATVQVSSPSSGTALFSQTAPTTLRTGVYTLFLLGDAGSPVGVLRSDRLTDAAAIGSTGSAATASAQ